MVTHFTNVNNKYHKSLEELNERIQRLSVKIKAYLQIWCGIYFQVLISEHTKDNLEQNLSQPMLSKLFDDPEMIRYPKYPENKFSNRSIKLIIQNKNSKAVNLPDNHIHR